MVASEHTKGRSKRAKTVGSAAVAAALVLAMPAYASEPLEELTEDESRQQLFQAPMAPAPFAFASRAVSEAIGILGLHQQSALVTDDSYRNSTIAGNNSIILGSRGTMNGYQSVAYGNVVNVQGNQAAAVGAYAKAMATGASAFGYDAQALAIDATALGRNSHAAEHDATAIGYSARATGRYAAALGSSSAASGLKAAALGSGALATADYGVGVGSASHASGHSSVAVGTSAKSMGAYAVTVGHESNVAYNAHSGMALGMGAQVKELASGAVALGSGSVATVGNTVSVGNTNLKRKIVNLGDGEVSATSTDAVTGKQLHAIAQVGSETAKFFKVSTASSDVAAHASGIGSVSIGGTSSAQSAGSVAIGASAVAGASSGGNGSIAVGWRANAAAGGDIAFGSNSVANSKNAPGTTNKDFSASIGSGASVTGGRSLAVGNGASVQGAASTADMRGLAVGNGAAVRAMTGTALGYEASATAQGAVALGANSQAGTANTVSVGNASLKRKIVNVADGEVSAGSSDAVTGKQLHAITSGPNVILGQSAATAGGYAIAIGARSSVNTGGGVGGIALGADARAGTPGYSGAMALGGGADASYDGVAVGHDAKAQAGASVALGRGSVANVGSTVSVGNDTLKRRIVNVAAGTVASDSNDAITGGQLYRTNQAVTAADSKATAASNVAATASTTAQTAERVANAATARLNSESMQLGNGATAGSNASAMGKQAAAAGSHSNAIGAYAASAGANAIAMGTYAAGASDSAVAVGNRAGVDATAANSVALGANAKVNANANNAIALGAGSVAPAKDTVSVGSTSLQRKVVNVADGALTSTSTDAVTGKQLFAATQKLDATDSKLTVTTATADTAKTTAERAGTTATDALTKANALGGLLSQASATASVRLGANNAGTVLDVRNKSNAGRVVTGLANGAVTNTSTDAVTGKQLFDQQQSVNANASKIGANESGIVVNETAIGKNRDDIAANRTSIGDNRIAIEALRSDFNDYVPELEDVVMFNADRTRVDMEGARVTGLLDGDVSVGSKDAVTGGQLFATNHRLGELEVTGRHLAIGDTLGSDSASAGVLGVALGASSEASLDSEGAVALGSFAVARGINSVALGRASHVRVDAEEGFALGTRSLVAAKGSIAAGAGSQVLAGATNSVALGYAAVASEANTISVGDDILKRRIVNVGRGTKDNDATTVAQLKGVLDGLGGGAAIDAAGTIINPRYLIAGSPYSNVGDALSALDSSVLGAKDAVESINSRLNRMFQEEATARTDGPGRLNLGGASGMVLGNVANGIISAGSRDAVNGGQLYEVRKDLQGQIDNLADGEKRVAVRGRMAAPAPMSAEGGGDAVASADAPASTLTPTPTPTPVASEASTPEPIVKAEGDTAVAVGSEGKERSVKHVAKGTTDTDAVNVAQLNDVLVRSNEYTDQAVEGLNKRLDGMDKRFNRMAAMSSAQSAMAMNTAGLNTYNRLGAGMGHSDGESALAVGYQRVMNERGSATFSLNGAFTNSGEKTVGVGVGIGW